MIGVHLNFPDGTRKTKRGEETNLDELADEYTISITRSDRKPISNDEAIDLIRAWIFNTLARRNK
jgi:hypothetical protein